MKTYFSIARNYSKAAFGLKMDYALDAVQDTLALHRPEPTPEDFLDKFSYEAAGGEILEDMLANNMGWNIFSSRVASCFLHCQNSNDIELLSLPTKAWHLSDELREYRVLGIKREITCVDLDKSEILWGSLPNGGRHISSFRECILRESAIPGNVDVFHLAEYPVMPVISSRLAMTIAEVHPTGFIFRDIKAW